MESKEVRRRFLSFFENRGHAIIPSASLVPENDPSVLFNTAGMQPLVPYLLGEEHPKGKRLANIQKCVRTGDLEEVGDNTHLTFFEMMGNWSLGDYFKKDSINWSYQLLTSKEEGFGLDPQRLYVTCFEGDENAPRDEESFSIWKEIFEKNGVTGERIYFRPKEKNWWSAGPNGPCGPDTEMFYDLTGDLRSGMSLDEYLKADDEQRVVEIWNNVFMEYLSKEGRVIDRLANKNVDTGSGFERVVMTLQGKSNVFETDLFLPLFLPLQPVSNKEDRLARIVCDHIRTAVFMISDGVLPSNTEKGYILRRLIRRAVVSMRKMQKDTALLISVASVVVGHTAYRDTYSFNEKQILDVINLEIEKFKKTIDEGFRQFEKGEDPFVLFTTYGFPFELTKELAAEKGIVLNEELFKEEFKKHQELSRAGAEQKFKGGLSGTGEMETKYHSATHLLHQALRDVLGTSVAQKGSNITAERLRFDFAFERKMTDEEKKQVEDIVNEKIQLGLPMQKVVMKKDEAVNTGALHFFGDKYGDEVSVYFIGDSLESAYSKEFCGGPHVENIGTLGHFKISKEEAVSSGVRRIKAILE
ncbi:MAG: alanine--tRNA ligase [Patescibacteria group bacterium]